MIDGVNYIEWCNVYMSCKIIRIETLSTDVKLENGAVIRNSGRVKPGVNYDDGIVIYNFNRRLRQICIEYLNCRYIWLVKDGLGLTCATITWLLIAYAQFVVIFIILMSSKEEVRSIYHAAVFEFITFLAVSSHLKAMLSDPGAIERENATKEHIAEMNLRDGQVIYKCVKCNSIKPDRAHHCSTCQRCVRRMDHHCPWVNNCVGEENIKYFLLFTMYICLMSCHALYLAIYHLITCTSSDWANCRSYSPGVSTILSVFLIVEALLFGSFTAIMFFTQLAGIGSDETTIESLKKEEVEKENESCWYNLQQMFGPPFSYRWFSPFHSSHRHIYTKLHSDPYTV